MQYDLAIEEPSVGSLLGDAIVHIAIHNRGYDTVRNASVIIFANSTDTLAQLAINERAPGTSDEFDWQGHFTEMYTELTAKLSDDDRSRNNTVVFTVPGAGFPAFTLSEIAPSEREGIFAEWIELHKRTATPWDLVGWELRTDRGETIIVQFTELVPLEYVILTEDAVDFQSSYPQTNAHIVEPPDWVELINDHGKVSLYDPHGILADSFSYTNGDDVLIWSKADTALQSTWGVSSPLLGTPGEPNSVVTALDSSVTLHVEPQILATDKDELTMEITFTAPSDEPVTLKLFDKGGKEVRTFFDEAVISTHTLSWNGRDNDNRRLPIGIYILCLQAGSAKAIKQSVVIAR
jgi:hypothetical protein